MFAYSKFFIFFLLLFPLIVFSTQVKASGLADANIFLGRMQVDKETDIVLIIEPNSSFSSGTEINIRFLDGVGQWCSGLAGISVEGTEFSLGELITEDITPLPYSGAGFVGTCIPGNSGYGEYDIINIQNVGELEASTNYGLKIPQNSWITTSWLSGDREVLIEVSDGVNTEIMMLIISLIDSDSIQVSAVVSEISTISCSISNSNLSFGTLPKDGTYKTAQHTLTTNSTLAEGYYWAVFGQGNGSEAGLWKSTTPTHLIPSTGSTTVNLLNNHGFGVVLSAPNGVVLSNFRNLNPGVFGAVNSGAQNARLMFYYKNPPSGQITLNATLGARASVTAEVGPYSETLTYICGGLY